MGGLTLRTGGYKRARMTLSRPYATPLCCDCSFSGIRVLCGCRVAPLNRLRQLQQRQRQRLRLLQQQAVAAAAPSPQLPNACQDALDKSGR